MTRRTLTLVGALAITLLLAIFADRDPGNGVVAAVERSATAPVRTQAARAQGTPAASATSPTTGEEIAAVRDRNELLGGDADGSATLFASHSWTPPPPPAPAAPLIAAPPPKPSAPPLPFTYLGKKLENGKWEAYLARGGDTYVVQEHSVIDGTYRAEAMTSNALTLTYLPLRQTQRLAIGGE